MPFFIFKISANNELEYLDEEEKYRPAREKVRALRATQGPDDSTTFRMVFAKTVGQGEKLLSSGAKSDKIIGDD
jgi:hypothetical protein